MKNAEYLRQAIARCISISGIIITLAFLIFARSVFIPTRWPFQFLVSGITIGLTYTSFREKYYREGLGLLVLWYTILLGFIGELHGWIFILEGAYIILISVAVYLFIKIIQKPTMNNKFLRVCSSTVILGVVNSFIIVVLNLFSISMILSRLPEIFNAMLLNLKIGAMLGLFMGIGIELSDTLIIPKLFGRKVAG